MSTVERAGALYAELLDGGVTFWSVLAVARLRYCPGDPPPGPLSGTGFINAENSSRNRVHEAP